MAPVVWLILFWVVVMANAHGCMNTPNQRGTLAGRGRSGQARCSSRVIDWNAEVDYLAHFPAGPRTGRPGEGIAYQRRMAGRFGWVPFEPLKRGFRWRAGVCGDTKSRREAHRKGGKYFHHGMTAASYPEGGVISLGLTVNAHHNGFIELHICNADRCGGDISESCFRNGFCRQLLRARVPSCDSGYNRYCAPIDPRYPGRWYLPCSNWPLNDYAMDHWGVGGKGHVKYQLPRGFTCNHCVLQWFWTAANTCNPPGVREYFKSRYGPKNWGRCKGQGGARGGYIDRNKPCGGRDFPEEYLQCADIKVYPRGGSKKRKTKRSRRGRRRRY